jgi:hypothetical protein
MGPRYFCGYGTSIEEGTVKVLFVSEWNSKEPGVLGLDFNGKLKAVSYCFYS